MCVCAEGGVKIFCLQRNVNITKHSSSICSSGSTWASFMKRTAMAQSAQGNNAQQVWVQGENLYSSLPSFDHSLYAFQVFYGL